MSNTLDTEGLKAVAPSRKIFLRPIGILASYVALHVVSSPVVEQFWFVEAPGQTPSPQIRVNGVSGLTGVPCPNADMSWKYENDVVVFEEASSMVSYNPRGVTIDAMDIKPRATVCRLEVNQIRFSTRDEAAVSVLRMVGQYEE
jgi:hypothetical protein